MVLGCFSACFQFSEKLLQLLTILLLLASISSKHRFLRNRLQNAKSNSSAKIRKVSKVYMEMLRLV